jgi:hypothetical protein
MLSARTRHCLRKLLDASYDADPAWHPDPYAVARFTPRELMREPNFGRVSLAEVEKWLANHGLKLADHDLCPTCGRRLPTHKAKGGG